MARTERTDRTGRNGVQRPSLFWFLLLDGGIVVLARLALSRKAYDKAGQVGGDALPPREVLQTMLVGTAVIHAAEALAAGRMARRRGLSPRGWRLQTFVVGFPSLLALRRSGG
jgi:Transmembrane protein 254